MANEKNAAEYPEKLTSGYYRVKMNWEDEKAIAQYRILSKAKETADKNPGSFVFSNEGETVYPVEEPAETKVTDDADNVTAEESDNVTAEPDDHVEDAADGKTQAVDNPVAYCKLKTLMNIRKEPSLTADKVTVYRKNVICEVLEVCNVDGVDWLKISCPESDTGYAYVSNENDQYAHIGRSLYKTVVGDSIGDIAEKKLGNAALAAQIRTNNNMMSNTLLPNTVLLMP